MQTVSTSRMSSSRATSAAGTRPPRVTAMMPRNGPCAARRQASARASRSISSQLTGKFFLAATGGLLGANGAGHSAHVDLDLVALDARAGRGRESDAIGRQAHIRQRAQHAFGIALGGVAMQRHLGRAASIGRYRDEIEARTRPALQRLPDGRIESFLVGNV